MYTLNTQLANFKYNHDFKKMIVNVTWYRLESFNDAGISAFSFSKEELNLLQSFIDKNPMNFPGLQFVKETPGEGFNTPAINGLSKSPLPIFLILSKQSVLRPDDEVCQSMMIVLTDKNYEMQIDYNLDIDVVGRIEIYREVRLQ
ncbi:hypothetical protein OD917_05140 [Flavobacterium sp. SH_e]|uniref:hypothetical protein n=1 Tax=Flavobacterium TaxID=237 RepID=UPI0021E4ED70|nr:hypothetical protein [Flavobacterium sp. SH_e]MCV2484295.1 hypothetical protein [Flavobacterium sp. SH_e]